MVTIAILNGPNLNRLGKRKPEVYGSQTMAQILLDIQRRWPDVHFVYRQSNHEGDLIDWIQNLSPTLPQGEGDEDVKGIVLNAGGYSHTSVALRDAVEESEVPVVEVHISDISQREAFRRVSLLTDVCAHSIKGIGTQCYANGVDWLLNTLRVKMVATRR
ncbi:MAG: type II 3-dehydroquinate dehydratase [Paludibacteraceae bacterium]|nr:type II 3-dehydroquinate dehydratase [Paludibacteraceae bacterium]